MTKKQLLEAIQHLPDNMDVFMAERHGLIKCEEKEVVFYFETL